MTEDHLRVCARLLAGARRDALAMAAYEMGDDSWSVGCRAYAFGKQRLKRVAGSRQHNWLHVLDDSHHFVFLIEDVPVRFYRGLADEPTNRTLRRQQTEAEQLGLALGEDLASGLVFRLAIETNPAGGVERIVPGVARRGGSGGVRVADPARRPRGAGAAQVAAVAPGARWLVARRVIDAAAGRGVPEAMPRNSLQLVAAMWRQEFQRCNQHAWESRPVAFMLAQPGLPRHSRCRPCYEIKAGRPLPKSRGAATNRQSGFAASPNSLYPARPRHYRPRCPRLALFRKTEARYQALRRDVLEEGTRKLRALLSMPDLHLGELDWEALGARSKWVHVPGADGDFDWEAERERISHKLARFSIALWHGDLLCGLAAGKPSPGKTLLRIHLIEGNPDRSHPLRGEVVPSVVRVAAMYAKALRSEEIRIMSPLPGALKSYRRVGFVLPKGFTYPTDPNVIDGSLQPPYCAVRLPGRRTEI